MPVGASLSNHPVDQAEVGPTVTAIPEALGTPEAAALDQGYFSAANIELLEGLGIEPDIATGREPHQLNWETYFAEEPAVPCGDASPKEQMAYKLRTAVGQAIYRLRKCTVEPVIGIIKDTLGFRQFSLRGLAAAAGEWGLVCLAYNLKRLHVLGRG
jgi:DDE family transposase